MFQTVQNEVHARHRRCELVARDMPLIFDDHTPRHAVAAAIVSYNNQLANLPGEAYFVELPQRCLMYGEPVYVSRLYADDVAWQAFQEYNAQREPLMEASIELEPINSGDISSSTLFFSAEGR